MPYRDGDYYLICDRTGEKIRRSEAVVQWNGLIVKRGHDEPRHPNELRHELRPARQPQLTAPEPPDSFVGPGDVTY